MRNDLQVLMNDAKTYVDGQSEKDGSNVVAISFVREFKEMGFTVTVFQATLSDNTEFWVLGGSWPMNLYSKENFKSYDEAWSMHLGLMLRMQERQS